MTAKRCTWSVVFVEDARTRTYFTPLESPVLVDGTIDAKGDAPEPPETAEDTETADTEYNPLGFVGEPARREDEVVDHVREHQDREVQGRQLNVGIVSTQSRASPTMYSRSDEDMSHGP